MSDDLDAPRCPVHLETLLAVGDRPDGRDVRWVCPVEGCGFVAIA